MCCAEDEQAAVTATAREVAGDRGVADLDRADIPGQNRERIAPAGNNRNAAMADERSLLGAVCESRLNCPAQRHFAGNAVYPPHQLAVRGQSFLRQCHRIGHTGRAGRGRECRLENVRIWQIAPRRFIRNRRGEREPSAAFCIEERCEDAGRVKVRQAKPIDRPVATNKRNGAAIADRRVVADWQVAVAPSHCFVSGPQGTVLTSGGSFARRTSVRSTE